MLPGFHEIAGKTWRSYQHKQDRAPGTDIAGGGNAPELDRGPPLCNDAVSVPFPLGITIWYPR